MSYQHEHIPLYDPKTGYEHIASVYAGYHQKLNQWDLVAIKKYLPRSLHGYSVLDLGGGDGRLAIALRNYEYAQRTIVDISPSLLANAPQRVEKCCADLRDPLPLPADTYHLIICSFVVLHLDHIDTLLQEARRCIQPNGRMLLLHHYERRPYVHTVHENAMKIKTWHWRHQDIKQGLVAAGREVDAFPVDELTQMYCCFPM